jgi:phosphoribosylpyrophosphate synthetase
MSAESNIRKEKEYRDRYALLKKNHPDVKNLPPIQAFIKNTLPYLNKDGYVVYERALSLERSWAEEFWLKKTNKLTKKEREDFQIALIKPYNVRNGDSDFSGEFFRKIKKNQKGPHEIFEFKRTKHEPNFFEYSRETIGMVKTNVAYIVGSVVTDQDLKDVQTIAANYRRLGVKEIVLISPYFLDEREDKNVGTKKNGSKYYNGRDIKIRTDMQQLSGLVDKIMTCERHSGAMDAFGAIYNIAIAPISFEEELIGQVKDKFLNKEERKLWELLSPDTGRTLVGERISEKIGKKPIHLEQIRNTETGEKEMKPLTPEQNKQLHNKHVMLYDDEGGTLGTIKNCVFAAVEARVKSIHIFLGHARLQKGWRKNLKEILDKCKTVGVEVTVYTTDSRVPIGHLKMFADEHKGYLKIISIVKKVNNMLEAAMAGINLWKDKDFNGIDWEESITQAIK